MHAWKAALKSSVPLTRMQSIRHHVIAVAMELRLQRILPIPVTGTQMEKTLAAVRAGCCTSREVSIATGMDVAFCSCCLGLLCVSEDVQVVGRFYPLRRKQFCLSGPLMNIYSPAKESVVQPDAWMSEEYRPEFGPKGQWDALRRFAAGESLSEKDHEWLNSTSEEDVDGAMLEKLQEWKRRYAAVVATRPPTAIGPKRDLEDVIHRLLSELEREIDDISTGVLTEKRAAEIAKFRTMQLRSMELMIQAGNLHLKMRGGAA